MSLSRRYSTLSSNRWVSISRLKGFSGFAGEEKGYNGYHMETVFQFSCDYPCIRSILTEGAAYVRMVNDDAPDRAALEVEPMPGIRYVLALRDSSPVAVFMLIGGKHKAAVHFCMLPKVWGATREIAAAFLCWVWRNTRLIWLKAACPSYNRLALKLALDSGFRPEGIEENAGTKRGNPFNLCWLSCERPREYA